MFYVLCVGHQEFVLISPGSSLLRVGIYCIQITAIYMREFYYVIVLRSMCMYGLSV